MDKAIYTAMTGAQATLRSQAAVSHNLANVGTTGFKAALVGTEFFQVEGRGLPSRFDAIPAKPGFDASTGALQVTGNELDVAFSDGVWMTVLDASGREAYTRGGELRVSPEGLLKTAAGLTVSGGGAPIAVPPNQKLLIGADGTISVIPSGQGPATLAQVGRLKLVLPDQRQLKRGEDGLFRSNGEPQPAVGSVVTSGALEGSNVQAAGALVQMIELQRQFEMQVKLIKDAEENAATATSLLRMT